MLNQKEIEGLIKEKDLINGYMDLDVQLTPNGIDLTVAQVFEFDQAGQVDFSNKERVVPEGRALEPKKIKPEDKFGWWQLAPGAYKVRTNEVVNLPNDLIALAYTRTTLLRMGALTMHGVWDAGFKGRGEFILVVHNAAGIRIKQNARIAQLVFSRINETHQGYSGIYKEG